MRRSDAIAVGLLMLPVATMALAMAGFSIGLNIGLWQVPLAMAVALGMTAYLSKPSFRCNNMLWATGLSVLSIVLAGSFVMYTNADAEAYHRPAAVLLANGWNPLRLTEPEEIRGLMGGGFRPWHVAFLPRMGWVFGASFYKWTGFIEVADAINILLFIASLLAVRNWLEELEVGKLVWFWTLIICISPVVLAGLWGGSNDSAGYSAFLIAATCAQRKLYILMVAAMLVMSGLKFTGVILSMLIFVACGIACLMTDRKRLMRLAFIGMVTGMLILLVNASPYLTSFKNHGSPFYPSHSFVKSERFENEKNPITYDFGYMNEDAKAIGYFGRLSWAYLSQSLTKWYYAQKLDKPEFNPDFKVSGGVGGFGGVFRVMFVLALAAWPFVRISRIHYLAGLILASVLIQPTFFSGYARYVPQFYIFPIVIGLGIAIRCGRNMPARVAVFGISIMAFALYMKPISFWPLQWLISVQNIQTIIAARALNGVCTEANSLCSRQVLAHDCGVREDPSASNEGQMEIGSYFRFYKVQVPRRVEDWYSLAHVVSGNDPTIIANRNKNNIRFFFREFLPREIVHVPKRFVQLVGLRLAQVRRAL